MEAQINLASTVDEITRSDPDRALHVATLGPGRCGAERKGVEGGTG
ncbi:hypothetical protein [Streptomyces himalayensis]|uniref:Uncharacterized protein n=1 Tax=Streptomyces himalayensis subsp. himalayensis TaxID=2756131 RepID=A0A7W0DIN3_9ACTN|nr:hypothetical protein [Streptomyces himalayensis]MBA2945809.1 hypothetical protein [Streptomyces himalayensis subsp. himalayensis]